MAKLRTFYANGIPTEIAWTNMMADMKRAYDILSAHWDVIGISLRYDMLTLLKIFNAYHPVSKHPRPTGENWYYLIKSLGY